MRSRIERPDLLGKPLGNGEVNILSLASQGHSYAEIADMRGTCYQTVNNQMAVIFRKLDARNITHAIAIARDKGLV